ncbi:hypothetical protein LSAT2_011068 [Lamellibrachia satsuma]|nr:hypothetical protein LSAT2_011068 [Lamellibrachia satsuma]
MVALRMYATGCFQNLVAETIGIDQSTASRTIHRVTNALVHRMHDWVCLPTQQVADQQKLICDAGMLIINCVAKWPGSVHDARILRESPLFDAFESHQKPLTGVFFGDSGYMLRDWLLTPILNPLDRQERAYTDAHCITRSTVERCISVLKR